MYVHRGELLRAADEVARRGRGEHESLGGDALAVARDRHQRRAPGFRHGSERLLDYVGQAAALVAGSRIGAAISEAALEILVVPLHLADQVAADLFIDRSWREQVDGV